MKKTKPYPSSVSLETVLEDLQVVREIRLSYGARRKAARIADAAEAAAFGRKILDPGADREHFLSLYLDSRNVTLGWRVVSIGTVSSSLVHPREVFRPGIILGALSLVILHNHPSGDTSPSQEDLDVTERLVRAGAMLGMSILDHLILGSGGYTSLRDSDPALFASAARS